jgi:putative tryptophan/tyrosine transport system substrate-binding protein
MWGSAIGYIVTLTLSLLAAPFAVHAQQPTKVPRVGYLSDESSSLGSASFEPLAQGLRALGYLEERTIVLEHRYAEGNTDLLPGLAADLVRLKVDVIVTVGTQATQAAKNATETIPIVFTRVADPVPLGLVASLAQPSGNLTGVSLIAIDLATKWLELLTEAMPGVRRVGVFWDPTFPPAALQLREIEWAARELHLELHPVEVRTVEECETAVRAVVGQGAQALLVVPARLFTEQRHRLAALAVTHRLPTMLSRREHVEAGGLMAYGTHYAATYRRAATYVDKILKGAKPADLPVEQPLRFELIINLKTATALGLTIPASLLFQADEIIR